MAGDFPDNQIRSHLLAGGAISPYLRGIIVSGFVLAWIFGMDKGWQKITPGPGIKVPRIFYYLIKYVTALYLLFIMVKWLVRDTIPIFLLWKAWKNRAREIGGGIGVTR